MQFWRSFGVIPSGPAALWGLSFFIFLLTFSVVIHVPVSLDLVLMFEGSGIVLLSSLVNTLEKWLLSSSAICASLLTAAPVLVMSGPIATLTDVFFFT